MTNPEKISGTMDSLIVDEPPSIDWNIYRGETKTLTYKLRNTSYHVIKNVTFTAQTYIHSKEQGDLSTKMNYAQVGKVPDKINPKSEIEIKIKIEIPQNYSETIKYEGKTIEYPFRVATKAVGIKSIQEL